MVAKKTLAYMKIVDSLAVAMNEMNCVKKEEN
jgi:hypothetical protein